MSHQGRDIIALQTSLQIRREALLLKKVVMDSRIRAKKIYINAGVNRLRDNKLEYTIGELSLFAGDNSNNFVIWSNIENLINISEDLGKIKGAIGIIDIVIVRISPKVPGAPTSPSKCSPRAPPPTRPPAPPW